MKITQELLRKWDACDEGFRYFTDHWPDGAEYATIQESLRKDDKKEWSAWLTNAVWSAVSVESFNMDAMVRDEVAQALKITEGSPNSSSGNSSKAASSGNSSTAASSGDYSKAASSGNSSTAASSGDYSKAAANGKNTIAMVAGLNGHAKAGENGCIALCWHDGKRNRIVTGYVGENIKADTLYCAKDGKLVAVET